MIELRIHQKQSTDLLDLIGRGSISLDTRLRTLRHAVFNAKHAISRQSIS